MSMDILGLLRLQIVTMPSSPQISCRIPHHWKDQLDTIARKSGRDRSAVVLEALGQYLGDDTPDSHSRQLLMLQQRMEALEGQVKALRVLMAG